MESVNVIGRGRVGSAVAARLLERGVDVREDDVELVLICVPDRAIAEVAASVDPGPWVAHVSGATPLAALEPHSKRLSVHPLQTFTLDRGPEQLDGAWAAVTAENVEARALGWELADTLDLRPFALADDRRVLYHAGAAFASSYLVTLHRAASRLFEDAGAPPEALVPLMTRTIENGFQMTGPIVRGDWAVVDAHIGALHAAHPDLEPLYRVLGGGDRGVIVTRTIAETRAALRGEVGLVPTMGAYHAGHLALFAAAREENDLVVASLFVNPAQFGDPADLARYPRDETADAAIAEENGVDVLFAPAPAELYPPGYETWVDVTEAARGLEGDHRPGHFRGVATVCLKLFNIVRPRRAYFGQKDAQQVEVLRSMVRDLNLELELRVLPTVRDPDGLALSSRNAVLSLEERAAALALPRALATRDPERARAALGALDIDYVEVAPFDPPVLAAAVRVGSVRLIDNVPLEGGPE